MKSTLALLAVLGLLPMAQAQTPPAHTPPTPAAIAQHQVQRYTTLLSLSANQVEQATTIFTTEATTAQEMSRSKERRKPTRHSGYRFPQRELRTIAFRMKDCFLE